MIKQSKKVTLSRHYTLETLRPLSMPYIIKEKDIYSMFSGLLSLMKEFATAEAKKSQIHNEISYRHLLNLYTNSVKQMNKYKSLYHNLTKIAK